MNYNVMSTVVKAVLARTDKDPVIIAIDGPSAGGKTAIAKSISDEYDCNVFHMDDFFLTPERKTQERLATPGGNVDYERFEEQVMKNLLGKEPFTYDIYSCKTGESVKSDVILPKRLNIVEGVYSMHPELMKYYEYTIFLDVERPVQLERILSRSNENMLAKFKNEWIPLEDAYFKAFNLRAKGDFALNTTKVFK
ncbi:MAG: uridine kinase [Oscillospiraceae bacterium]